MFSLLLKGFKKFGLGDLITKDLVKIVLIRVIREVFLHDDELIRKVSIKINDLSEQIQKRMLEEVNRL